MTKRTSSKNIESWDDARDIDSLVIDKRSLKRANGQKRRRRNRRYENRLLSETLNQTVDSINQIE